MHDVLSNIQSKPLPIVSKEAQDEAAAAAAKEGQDGKDKKKSGWAGAAGGKTGGAFNRGTGARTQGGAPGGKPAGAWGSSAAKPSLAA